MTKRQLEKQTYALIHAQYDRQEPPMMCDRPFFRHLSTETRQRLWSRELFRRSITKTIAWKLANCQPLDDRPKRKSPTPVIAYAVEG